MQGKYLIFILSALIAFGLSNGGQFKEKNDQFDWNLFNQIADGKKSENVISSPILVKFLLKVINEAASGKIKNQISEALADREQPGKSSISWYQTALKSLEEDNGNIKLKIGTKFFLDKAMKPPTSKFMKIAEEIYHTSLERLNFKSPQETANVINEWVKGITDGNIKDFIESGDVKGSDAILANALYFKAKWQNQFRRRQTKSKKFTLSSGERIDVDMMELTKSFGYLETNELGEGTKLLRMPFEGNKFAMTFILPKEADGLDKVLASITPGKISQLQNKYKWPSVNVQLPKFKFNTKSSLKDVLKELGINEIFTNSAKLPGLGNDFKVGKVFQEAGIQLNEEGTEVYAATAAVIRKISSLYKPKVLNFIANRPFAFFVEDESTGGILFIGKVNNPKSK